jgi:hypothetical protein
VAGGNFFKVDAQWALQGKTLGRTGYRVLACSTGNSTGLSAENFTEAISRFSMGTPETGPQALPQVTISYLAQGTLNHLALAIHQFASDAQTADGQLTVRDDDGRPVVATSYYCVPYKPVADNAVSYQAMYEAFAAAPLRPEPGPPVAVQFPLPAAAPPALAEAPAIDPLAIHAAALLLTGRPVCVLGGQAVSMTDRLAFIDMVMTLLPYGFRARMTAATWTRATNQNHRFRLFFSGAQRDAEQPDQVIFWGRPERTVFNHHDEYAYWYRNWLIAEGADQARSVLSKLRQPRSLATKNDVLEALDAIDTPILATWKARLSRRREIEAAPKQADLTGKAAAQVVLSEGERCLLECAQYMEKRELPLLGSAINQLKGATKVGVSPDQRARYLELIQEHRLFRHDEALGNHEGKLREALLRLAFTAPFGYEDYCLVEDGIGEAPPDSALLQLIDKTGPADLRAKAIVYRQLPNLEAEKKLDKWYSSKDLSADQLLNALALEVKRPQHMKLLCDVTVGYLRKMNRHYKPDVIERVLRQHSYLARKLQDRLADQNQYQINTLGWLLKAAYPNGLTRSDIYHVMIGTREPPTFPFLAAVLLMLTDPAESFLARELFVFSSFITMNLEPATNRALEKIIVPDLQAPSGQQEPTPLQRKAGGPASPDDRLPAEGRTHQPQEGAFSADSAGNGSQPPQESPPHQEDGIQSPYQPKHGPTAPRVTHDGP